jgi:hypothetical protein
LLEDVGLHAVGEEEVPEVEDGVELENSGEEGHDPFYNYDFNVDIHFYQQLMQTSRLLLNLLAHALTHLADCCIVEGVEIIEDGGCDKSC